ncbi:MAG: methionine--tRNA ligase [Chloroherpetonaceae bacterium]|nr:methionine--tRNA ligase [Chthonomonadaceae bacterium]MDW8208939.1 methionine--tRNA ligase [Chloroherpetonaceae bacterium]
MSSDHAAKKYYVTTPIYYVNGQPHVGSALTTVSCDVLVRYQRLLGRETYFVTGTDENATKVQDAAEKAGIPTKEFTDQLAAAFQQCWRALHIEYSDFIRTTEARHVHAVQTVFRILSDRGYIYRDDYEGWYSVSDETFFRDSEVRDGVAIETGKPVVWVKEPNYFFRLSAFHDRLMQHIEAHPDFLQPEFRRNEVIRFINEGLRDMSIARPRRATKGWGIPVPDDPDQIIYVWFDALISYLAATGWPEDPGFAQIWPADLHFMGKEIFVRFHATLWPAMLMALDLPLPTHVYAHGWWVDVEGRKAGKSTGGLPHPVRFAELLMQRSGADFDLAADALRYLLCREMNYEQDVEFSVEKCLLRFNSDLANDLGNLLNRSVNMMLKFYDGVVPADAPVDAEIAQVAAQVREDYARAMSEYRLHQALAAVWRLVGRMNRYIDERAPWALARAAENGDETSRQELATVMYACLEATRIVSILIAPFMPVAADALRAQLGITQPVALARWEDLHWGGLPAGTRVGPPKPLFPRIQDLRVDVQTLTFLTASRPVSKEDTRTVTENTTATAPTPGTPVAPPEQGGNTPLISIEDFAKVELRVGEVLAAEPVPNTDKLLRLTVQTGEDETRTILSGIAEYYRPEELVGRQIVVICNLQPRRMRGIESQGMLLAADVGGRPVLLQPDSIVPVGARIR